MEAIKSLCAANLASLDVNYQHLSATFPILAFWLADAPLDMLDIFDEVGILLFFPLAFVSWCLAGNQRKTRTVSSASEDRAEVSCAMCPLGQDLFETL